MTKAKTGCAGTDNVARKRRNWADKRDGNRSDEKAANRARMAVYRARQRAMKMAVRLAGRLDDAERMEVEELVARQRQRFFCDWFRSRNMVSKINPNARFTEDVLGAFMTKVDIHKVELKVAEYKICVIKEGLDNHRNSHITGANRISGAPIARAFANGDRIPQANIDQVATSPVSSSFTDKSTREVIGNQFGSQRAASNRMASANDARAFAKGQQIPQTVIRPNYSTVTSGPPRKIGAATPTDAWAVPDGVSNRPTRHNDKRAAQSVDPSARVAEPSALAVADEEMADFLNDWQLDVADTLENLVSSENEEDIANTTSEASPVVAGARHIKQGHKRLNSFDMNGPAPVLEFLDENVMFSW